MTAGAAPPPELTLSFDYQSPFASLQRPQYRLRVEDIRIFYDVEELVFRPFFPTFRRELRLTLGQIELAGAAFRDAIALALTMRAKSFDLRATTRLARLLAHQSHHDAACTLLAEIYGRFTQGFDTRDLQDTKALRAELGAR